MGSADGGHLISGVMVVGVAPHFTVFSNEGHPRYCSTDRGWLDHEQGEPQDSPLLLLIKPERLVRRELSDTARISVGNRL